MTDPAGDAARSAAAILAPDLGPNLPAEVEAALAARDTQQRPDQYFDPIGLASLIVSIATLAWTIYDGQREYASEPERSEIEREVRIIVRDQDMTMPTGTERVIEVVATEIIRKGAGDGTSPLLGDKGLEPAKVRTGKVGACPRPRPTCPSARPWMAST